MEEFIDDEKIVLACLEFFNNLVQGDEELIIKACQFGLITLFRKFLNEGYEMPVKIEAVFFLGNTMFSKATRSLFVSCGGPESFNFIFDLTEIDKRDLVTLGIDALLLLLENRELDVFHILTMIKKYLIEKLLLVIDYYSTIVTGQGHNNNGNTNGNRNNEDDDDDDDINSS